MGIIGCGTHAEHHAKNYLDDFTTHGVWDPDPKAMEMIESNKKYASLAELLADKEIVAVMICSPDEYHLGQIESALVAGKHVFCEKPLMVPGQDLAQLEAAFDLAEKKRLILTSCHPRRFDRPICWLQDGLGSQPDKPGFLERFGKVVSFDFDFSYHAPSNAWKHTRSLLLDHINHEVDLMNALFGIQSFEAWKLQDGFDHYDAVGRRDDGITFRFRGTRRLKEHVYPEWCRVRFECGEVALDMMMAQATVYDHDHKTAEVVPGLAIDYEGRLQKVMTDFHDSLLTPGHSGYLLPAEMLMNTEAGIVLQNEGVQRVSIRNIRY
ncbi:MAG: Gfo/Idh/MocA family oxidoreductase [Patescibacteria group bacterium]